MRYFKTVFLTFGMQRYDIFPVLQNFKREKIKNSPRTVKTEQLTTEERAEEVAWHIRQTNLFSAMDTEIRCLKKDMLLIRYEAPDGKMRHRRLWNGGNGTGKVELYHDGALVDIVKVENAGCEYGEYGPASAWYGPSGQRR